MTPANAPAKRSRKTSRRSFGAVRKLPSSRFQARYKDDRGVERTAPRTFTTRTAADEWLTTERADLIRGAYRSPDLGATPLADYYADWLSQHTGLAPSTREQYVEHGKRWINRELMIPPNGARKARTINLGTRDLNTLSVGMIREWFAAASYTQQFEQAQRTAIAVMRADRRHPARIWAESSGLALKPSGRLSPTIHKAWERAGTPMPKPADPVVDPHAKPATIVRQAYRTLRACLYDALRDGLILANPCQLQGAGVGTTAERRPATVTELCTIAAAMPARYAAAVLVAAWTGLRSGELFGLAREHVDLEEGTIRVVRAMKTLKGQPPHLGPTKTEASRRIVHVPPHVLVILSAHMATYTGAEPEAFVFARPDGALVPRWEIRAGFVKARAVAGRDDLRWHDLRHTGATLAAQTGASIRDIQHRLGHSTIVAAIGYQHTSPERDREIAERLSDIASVPANVRPMRSARSA
jgi:integrase